jgi:hypothetical protein
LLKTATLEERNLLARRHGEEIIERSPLKAPPPFHFTAPTNQQQLHVESTIISGLFGCKFKVDFNR